MRIISGRWKGRFLVAPRNLPVRPTTDMAKESLFNILNNYFDMDEVTVTDLFAGTGNISYEFASRGAISVRSVDMDRGCTRYIAQTSATLGFEEQITVINSDVFRYLSSSRGESDIIFADPPYDMAEDKYKKIVSEVFDRHLLSEEGILVVEHPASIDLSSFPQYTQTRRYGTVHFSYFEWEREAEETEE